jgi:hypothetical protein
MDPNAPLLEEEEDDQDFVPESKPLISELLLQFIGAVQLQILFISSLQSKLLLPTILVSFFNHLVKLL